MARQRKTLTARRKRAVNSSLLIQSAESLGRMIGSLQRQLDAARALTVQASGKLRGNGHAAARTRTAAKGKIVAGKKVAVKKATRVKSAPKTTTTRRTTKSRSST
jgi:hypothetical protein